MRKLLVILFSVFIASCSKDEVAVSNAPIAGTLNKTIMVIYNVDFETELSVPYDTVTTLYDNGRIKSVESKKNYFFNKTYTYDDQGRMVKYNTYGRSIMMPLGSSFLEYRFSYENGHVSGIEEYVSTATGQIKYFSENYKFENNSLVSIPIEGWAQKTFNFNEKGQLVKYERILRDSVSEEFFEYDSNGNIFLTKSNFFRADFLKTNYVFLEGKNPSSNGFKSTLESHLIINALDVNTGIADFVSFFNSNLIDISAITYEPGIGSTVVKDEFEYNQNKFPKNKKYFYKKSDKMVLGHTIDYFYN